MTADLEAVTRTLAEEMWADFREMYPGVECTLDMAKYEEPWVQGERHTILALAARLAPVLVSLPDDRLAEAEAKVRAVEAQAAKWRANPDDLWRGFEAFDVIDRALSDGVTRWTDPATPTVDAVPDVPPDPPATDVEGVTRPHHPNCEQVRRPNAACNCSDYRRDKSAVTELATLHAPVERSGYKAVGSKSGTHTVCRLCNVKWPCEHHRVLSAVLADDADTLKADVPPDPPAADRDELARVVVDALTFGRLEDDESITYREDWREAENAEILRGSNSYSTRLVVAALLSSGVLVDAANVRARHAEQLARDILREGGEDFRYAATWLRDRAVSEREGTSRPPADTDTGRGQ